MLHTHSTPKPQKHSQPASALATAKADRFIGLDIHKEYAVAVGVDREQNQVFGPQRVSIYKLEAWAKKHLSPQDAVVLEMTTNTYAVHDILLPYVVSVTVVHPPHVALIVRAQVKTDKKAAMALAQLHAAGLLPGIWVPPLEVRERRSLVSQREKMVRLATQAKNRLHSTIHTHRLHPPEGFPLFAPELRPWWEALRLPTSEKVRVLSDLNTLAFAQKQVELLENSLAEIAAQDERVPLLVQIPGVGMLTAVTILAAVGIIERFPEAKKLVGYAGLGSRVHDSGKTRYTGRITKAGRRDLRGAMVDAANHAIRSSKHWKAVFKKMEPRMGRSKAVVAIARKLLVVVWHVLTKGEVDRFAEPEQVARLFFGHAYRVGVKNLPGGQSAIQYTRSQLDRLGIGREMKELRWGSKRFKLPPSGLPPDD